MELEGYNYLQKEFLSTDSQRLLFCSREVLLGRGHSVIVVDAIDNVSSLSPPLVQHQP